jgi:hypothetical protein
MAKVNHLEGGLDPPEGGKYVIVARDVTGGFYVESSEPGYERGAPPTRYPIDESEREKAIARAAAHADQNEVETVYVIS